jgi:predicted porin
MKKSLLALAVLGAFAGVASAQSTVTLSGTVDLSAKYVKNTGSDRRYSLSQDGINSSQLVFSGKEDLGGGLWAGFTLNSGVNADTGTSNSKFWNRRSTVSLGGNFGEIRLGHDYTPTFWNNTFYDAFGTNGLGDSSHVGQLLTGTFVRADNSITYWLPPNLGGFNGEVMVAASEGAATNPGRYVGGRFGFAAGPVDAGIAFAEQRFDALAGHPQQKTFNVGGSYDLGVVKLLGYYDRDTLSYAGVDKKENRFSISAVIPFGQSEVHVGYDYSKLDSNGINTKVDEFAATYQYNLSKRTALYATAARLNNKNGTANSVTSGSSQTAAPAGAAGSSLKSTGAEFGLRHLF